MKVRYFLLVVFILLAWLLGSLIFTRPLERSLQRAAAELLAETKYHHAFDKVQIAFAGQHATLTGQVSDLASKELAEKIISQELRLRDNQKKHNPVSKVHNNITVDDSTLPRPWLIASVFEGKIRVDGILADPTQKLALIEALAVKLPASSRNDQCVIDTKTIPCKDWQNTLATVPDFTKLVEGKTGHAARFAAATTGNGEWKVFGFESANADIAASLAASGVKESAVEFALNPLRTEALPAVPVASPAPAAPPAVAPAPATE